MARILVFCSFLLSSATAYSQTIKFADIQVVINTDSLSEIVGKTSGFERLKSLLSLEQSLNIWEPDKATNYIYLLDSLTTKFPLNRSHYYYFRSKFDVTNSGSKTKGFFLAKKALQEYINQKDTTGIIASLVSLGTLTESTATNVREDSKFSQKYFIDAFELSKKTNTILAKLIGKYSLIKYFSIDVSLTNTAAIIRLSNEGLATIKKNKQYTYREIFFLNSLATVYSTNQ